MDDLTDNILDMKRSFISKYMQVPNTLYLNKQDHEKVAVFQGTTINRRLLGMDVMIVQQDTHVGLR